MMKQNKDSSAAKNSYDHSVDRVPQITVMMLYNISLNANHEGVFLWLKPLKDRFIPTQVKHLPFSSFAFW